MFDTAVYPYMHRRTLNVVAHVTEVQQSCQHTFPQIAIGHNVDAHLMDNNALLQVGYSLEKVKRVRK